MPTPASRVPVRVARGSKTNIDAAVASGDLKEGEIIYVTDENAIYVIEGGVLTQASADLTALSVGELADVDTTTTPPTDGQILVWVNANGKWEPADLEVVNDLTPQLGGDLDVQTSEITTSVTDGNVKIAANGTGVTEFRGNTGNDAAIQLNCEQNTHGVKIKSPPHIVGANYTLTLPDNAGQSGEALITDGSGGLSWASSTLPSGNDGEALIWENGSWTTGPVIGGVSYNTSADSSFTNVELLLFGNGNQGDPAVDSSSFNQSITSTATVDTVTKKYGTGSLDFGGTDFLYDTSIVLGTDTFTVEFWVYWASTPASESHLFDSRGYPNGASTNLLSDAFDIRKKSTGNGDVLELGTDGLTFLGTTALTGGQWYHIAVVRDSSANLNLYLNGTQEITANRGLLNYSVAGPTLGRSARLGTTAYSNGAYMDDVRITKGVARYTANFTPPLAELPAGGTQIDISYSIDNLDDVDISTVAPSDGQALVWDNANSQWKPGSLSISIDDLSDVDTSTAAPTDGQILTWDNANSYWAPAAGLPAASDGEALIYENGAWVAGPVIGGVSYNTSADPSFASVQLLLFGNGSQGASAVDSSNFNRTLSGSATVDTVTKKYGTGSLSFSGTNFLYDTSIALGTDIFTVEFWVYWATTPSSESLLFDSREYPVAAGSNPGSDGFDIRKRSTGDGDTLEITTNGTAVAGTTALAGGQWYHIAVVRNSNADLTLYLNGTQELTRNNGLLNYSSAGPTLGRSARSGTAKYSNGAYMDDIRITQGVARYTANFTPPAAELPAGGTQVDIPYSIDKLDDVDTSTVAPTDGQALVWDNAAGKWEPGTVSGGGGATVLDDLTDVDTTTVAPSDGDTLVYDNASSEFIPGVRVKSDTAQGGTGSSAVANIVTISQVDYDALATPDANTIYFIV